MTLLLFRHAQRAGDIDELVGRLARYAELVREVVHAPNGARAIGAVMRYIQSVTKQSTDEVRRAMQQHEVLVIDEETYWDIRSPGWREDRAHEEGLDMGQRLLLLKQLASRFGALTSDVTTRVETATKKQLERMSIKILAAQTIDEVLAETTPKRKTKKAK